MICSCIDVMYFYIFFSTSTMAPGRSKSARSDMSDSDDNEAYGEKEDELKKLQRQYRIMNNDRDAYTQESQDLIRKQRFVFLKYIYIVN
jgi:hypothetical protein